MASAEAPNRSIEAGCLHQKSLLRLSRSTPGGSPVQCPRASGEPAGLPQEEVLADGEVVEETLAAITGHVGNLTLSSGPTSTAEFQSSSRALESRHGTNQLPTTGALHAYDGQDLPGGYVQVDVSEPSPTMRPLAQTQQGGDIGVTCRPLRSARARSSDDEFAGDPFLVNVGCGELRSHATVDDHYDAIAVRRQLGEAMTDQDDDLALTRQRVHPIEEFS